MFISQWADNNNNNIIHLYSTFHTLKNAAQSASQYKVKTTEEEEKKDDQK